MAKRAEARSRKAVMPSGLVLSVMATRKSPGRAKRLNWAMT